MNSGYLSGQCDSGCQYHTQASLLLGHKHCQESKVQGPDLPISLRDIGGSNRIFLRAPRGSNSALGTSSGRALSNRPALPLSPVRINHRKLRYLGQCVVPLGLSVCVLRKGVEDR